MAGSLVDLVVIAGASEIITGRTRPGFLLGEPPPATCSGCFTSRPLTAFERKT
jgi:hypothetical protein